MKRARSPSGAEVDRERQSTQHALALLLREFPCMRIHLPLLRSRSLAHIEALTETMRSVTRQLTGASERDA